MTYDSKLHMLFAYWFIVILYPVCHQIIFTIIFYSSRFSQNFVCICNLLCISGVLLLDHGKSLVVPMFSKGSVVVDEPDSRPVRTSDRLKSRTRHHNHRMYYTPSIVMRSQKRKPKKRASSSHLAKFF